ncbi:tRNA-binding protein [Chromobacterium sp. ATCC 53434]|uniref:tRNA-binding protein n=1 Tax=Chromobacterium sp. (strain ATCC 53434 / SC 14030) TaxID=2059672 RepID=UPI000C7696D9|nr:tRNA-binding protein [Chromobacterium sp. ATCC 53434]AUH50836.1 tRNA-binding protein [Chromobacterium sp. ATCC 53434]
MNEIGWDDFLKVDLRVGTIVGAALNAQARKPAYVLTVDLGEMGVKTSSAQITHHYPPDSLIGRRVLCVCNFPAKRVAGVRSEVLVTGVYDEAGNVVLAEFALPAPNGGRLV